MKLSFAIWNTFGIEMMSIGYSGIFLKVCSYKMKANVAVLIYLLSKDGGCLLMAIRLSDT